VSPFSLHMQLTSGHASRLICGKRSLYVSLISWDALVCKGKHVSLVLFDKCRGNWNRYAYPFSLLDTSYKSVCSHLMS